MRRWIPRSRCPLSKQVHTEHYRRLGGDGRGHEPTSPGAPYPSVMVHAGKVNYSTRNFQQRRVRAEPMEITDNAATTPFSSYHWGTVQHCGRVSCWGCIVLLAAFCLTRPGSLCVCVCVWAWAWLWGTGSLGTGAGDSRRGQGGKSIISGLSGTIFCVTCESEVRVWSSPWV